MAETFSFLFAQFSFLLRDVFGYVVPGAIVLACFVYFFRVNSLTVYMKNVWDFKSAGAWIIAAVICYFVGHAVAGLAFNLWRGNPVYSYSPPVMGGDQPHIESWTTFIEAVDKLTNNQAKESMFRAERERLVVINQLSGNGSAACVACLLLGLASLLYHRKEDHQTTRTARREYYAILILVIFSVGLWLEHRRFREAQVTFEQDVISLAKSSTAISLPSRKP